MPHEDKVSIDRYATMSYRWGDDDFIMLTEETLPQYRWDMPIDALPATFRDVMHIVKSWLGFRYLWIDALCIIQSDKGEDKLKECARMAMVYSNTSLNIIATFGQSPGEDLSRDRDMSDLRVMPLKPSWTHGIENRYHSGWQNFDILVCSNQISHDLSNCAIASRGWILQELVLAPKSLYIGPNEVIWACSKFEASETWEHGIPSVLQNTLNTRSHNLRFDLQEDTFHWWKRMIERYSRLHLTNWTDKTLAFMGIVKLVSKSRYHNGDRYLAGHWEKMMPGSLCWYATDKRRDRSTGSRLQLAPTWSWISTTGEIKNAPWHIGLAILCSLDHIAVQEEEILKNQQDTPMMMVVYTGFVVISAPSLTATVSDHNVILDTKSGLEHHMTVHWDNRHNQNVKSGTTLELAFIMADREGAASDESHALYRWMFALILRKKPDHDNVFERVGAVVFGQSLRMQSTDRLQENSKLRFDAGNTLRRIFTIY